MIPLIDVKVGTNDRRVPDGEDVIFCGPWLGELGVEILRWVPYLRSIKAAHPEKHLLAAGYGNSYCLYQDFADEFWVLNDSYRRTFLNQETSFNYGVFHELSGNTAYREHAERKGFRDTYVEQWEIGTAWFRALEKRHLRPSMIVSALGESRQHRALSSSEDARRQAYDVLERKNSLGDTERILMLLPRLRALQGAQRSWSPQFYQRVITDLSELPKTMVVVLGSRAHEDAFASVDDEPHVINLVSAGLDCQLAFWEIAQLGSGPPSGGLVPGYFTATALLHWYKPGQFPTRHGKPWNEVAEPDYEIFGVKSDWIEVDETASSAQRLIDAVAVHLDRTSALAGTSHQGAHGRTDAN